MVLWGKSENCLRTYILRCDNEASFNIRMGTGAAPDRRLWFSMVKLCVCVPVIFDNEQIFICVFLDLTVALMYGTLYHPIYERNI